LLQSFVFCFCFIVQVLAATQQFKEDLLISCLQFLLSLPFDVVRNSLNKFPAVFKVYCCLY